VDKKGQQVKNSDVMAWLVLPMYKRIYAKWGKPETGVDIPLLLGHLFYSTNTIRLVDPLSICKVIRMERANAGVGLLTLSINKWNKGWKETFGEEIPNPFDVEKQIEFQIRYLTHFTEVFNSLDNALRAWFAGEDAVQFCLDNKVDWKREDSMEVILMAYYFKIGKKYTHRGAPYDVIKGIATYPGFVMGKRDFEVGRLEKLDWYVKKHTDKMKKAEGADRLAMLRM